MKCETCGVQIAEGSLFCPHCGTKVGEKRDIALLRKEEKRPSKVRGGWLAYAIMVSLILVPGLISELAKNKPIYYLDVVVSAPALVALWLLALKRRNHGSIIWKAYAVAFPLYDLFFNLVVEHDTTMRDLHSTGFIILAAFISILYVSTLVFAFKKDSSR